MPRFNFNVCQNTGRRGYREPHVLREEVEAGFFHAVSVEIPDAEAILDMDDRTMVHIAGWRHLGCFDVVVRAVAVCNFNAVLTHIGYDADMTHAIEEEDISRGSGVGSTAHLLYFSPGIGLKALFVRKISICRRDTGVLSKQSGVDQSGLICTPADENSAPGSNRTGLSIEPVVVFRAIGAHRDLHAVRLINFSSGDLSDLTSAESAYAGGFDDVVLDAVLFCFLQQILERFFLITGRPPELAFIHDSGPFGFGYHVFVPAVFLSKGFQHLV